MGTFYTIFICKNTSKRQLKSLIGVNCIEGYLNLYMELLGGFKQLNNDLYFLICEFSRTHNNTN